MQDIPFIPYFQTSRYRVDTMVELANPKPGEKGADLGSGDGRILIAFAAKEVEMHGFELDEKYREISERNIQLSLRGVKRRGNLPLPIIHQKDFWEEDLSIYNIITCYPMPDIIELLEKKLKHETKPGTRILLNYYPFPTWEPAKVKDNIYLYIR